MSLRSQLSHSSKLSYIFTPNSEQIVQATQDKEFFRLLQTADILIPDGVGLLWASKLLQGKGVVKLTERIAGSDVLLDLLLLASETGMKVLVVGGQGYQDAVESFPAKLTISNQGKTVEYFWMPGYAAVSQPTAQEELEVTQALQSLQPEIVAVALGAPWQERWLVDHRSVLEQNQVRLAMVVGGGMDYLTGKLPRAPRVLQQLGLEWLFRLFRQPWRWKRQLRLPVFIWLTLKELLKPA